jgi:glycosyltransferase involved in cell wall biosynthesis
LLPGYFGVKVIAYFTDCYIFGGCENMLVNFLKSKELAELGNINFFYNYSKAYEEGLKAKLKCSKLDDRCVPLQLLSPRFPYRIKNKILRKGALLLDGFILRYPVFLYNLLCLLRVFRKCNIDILHINNGGYPGARTCQAAVLAAKICGIKKIVYVANNLAFSYRNPVRWLDWPIDYLVSRKVAAFVTGSENAKAHLSRVLGVSNDRCKVLANGVRMREIDQEQATFIEKYQPTSKRRVVAAVIAHLDERKGHIYLLQALAKLLAEQRIMPLLLIEGEGIEYKRLTAFVKANNLEEVVVFLGSIGKVFDLINAADLIILPSIANEDFPNIVIEAMGLGKPVIGTNLAGIPEQIDHNETGLIVEPKDIDMLARAIEKLALDADLRNSMGEKGRIKYQKNYTEKVAVDRYMDIYNSLK